MGKLLGSQLHCFLVDAALMETMATAMRWIHIPVPAGAALLVGWPAPRPISPETQVTSAGQSAVPFPRPPLPVGECKLGFRGHWSFFVRHLRISAVHIQNGSDHQWAPGAFGVLQSVQAGRAMLGHGRDTEARTHSQDAWPRPSQLPWLIFGTGVTPDSATSLREASDSTLLVI